MSPALDPVERHVRERVDAALGDTRVVVVLGARQVGKSTLVEQIARERGDLTLRPFDDQAPRETAQQDPTGFVAGLPTPAVIDEVGPRFIAGALLYTGPNTLPAGDRIAAIPLSGLWET